MLLEWLKKKKGLVLDKIGCLHMVGFRSRSFLEKGENRLLNVVEFRGGSGGGNCVDLSALKTFRLRHSFVACI